MTAGNGKKRQRKIDASKTARKPVKKKTGYA